MVCPMVRATSSTYFRSALPSSSGGVPTATDRFHAAMMGAYAVDLLLTGKSNRVVAYRDGKYCDFDITEALKMKKSLNDFQIRVSGMLESK